MAKGTYSSQKWKVWFDGRRYERFKGEELVVGVDCAKTAFYASVMAGGWHQFDILYFERDDIAQLMERISKLDFKRITLVFEPTGTYSDPLVHTALEKGINVVRINGSRTKDAEKVFDGVASLHDGKAAYLLARLYLCGVGDEVRVSDPTQRNLRALVDLDRHFQRMEQHLLNPLEALLGRHWPELTGYLKLTSATLLELIGQFGSAQAVAAEPARARELMKKTGGPFLRKEKIEAVLASAANTIGVAPCEHERELLIYFAGMLRAHHKRSRTSRKLIEATALENEETRPLVSLAGKRLALTLVGMLGSLKSYGSVRALEKALGLNLCEYSTGKTRGDNRVSSLSISKAGPGYARSKLYFLAMRMVNPQISNCPLCMAWYAERLRLNGGHRIKALTALMRKLVGALFWMARGQDYDARRLFDARRLRRLGYEC